eukprot:TRINITY_DN4660_c0_g1_i1.p1 TRINITY_DN4660_c0_g1~~TRINITY_DN4660_c0_g1_i1.p1  ORF type:complete len:355 (+),score=95.85 TRINITY_DN4660_c0_g1_i1:56-1120(+)
MLQAGEAANPEIDKDENRLGGKALSLLRRASAPPAGLSLGPGASWWGPLDGPRPVGTTDFEQSHGQKLYVASQESAGAASAQEASALKLQLAALHREIKKKDAALASLPGHLQLDDEEREKVRKQSAPSRAAGRRSSVQLHEEGVMEDDGFVVVAKCTIEPGEESCVQLAMDINECKRMCRGGLPGGRERGAFVIKQGRCYFHSQTVSECRQHLVDDPECTTYLNSNPEAAALCADIRRAVRRRWHSQQQHVKKQLKMTDSSQAEAAATASHTLPIAGAATNAERQTDSHVWRECISALEGELRRKSAHSLELHRRVHALEAELQHQLQVNDECIDAVKSTLASAAARAKAQRT